MDLIIDLTVSEEAQLCEAATRTGLAPADLVKKLVKEHLSPVPAVDLDDLDAKLLRWQDQTGTKVTPHIPTQTLFAQWAAEDALMTDEERADEDRLWEDLEPRLAETGRALQLRHLGR